MKFVRLILMSLFLLIAFCNVCFAKTNEVEFTQAEKDFIQQHPVIQLGVDPKFIPYEFFDSDGQYKGIAADYLKLISERTGINIGVKQDITWSEAYEKAVEKKLDGLTCVTKTREREQYFLYSEPYYSFQRVIIVQNSNNSVSKLEDLFNKRVAVKKDGSHNSYLKTFSSIELSLYLTEEAALEAVAAGKESYYVGNLATSSYYIKTNGLTNLKYIPINSEDKQYLYFAVRNDWPELVSIINKGLASINGEEKIAINNRWIGFENKVDYGTIIKIIASVGIIIVVVFLISLFWIIKLKKEVSEKVKAQEALKVAKEEAEVANHVKSIFLARMSHEIRTPLNAITGMAYLIRKTNITATQKLYLDKITLASRNMLGIINDILDFSKIEAGKIEIEKISFNLDKVLQQVINIVSFRIEEQGIDFVVNKDPNLPVNFIGDPMRLEQILINIINNAIKFTTVGEVSVDVQLAAKENDTHHLEFKVKDTGIGMSNEQLSALFKPFDQGDSSINRRFGGTGLGLSIVKSLVDMLGGEIRVDSTVGKGSTFNIQLALEIDRNLEAEEENKQKSASEYFENIRVLVLEKSLTFANLLKDYLNSFSITAEFAVSEDQAKELLRNTINQNHKPYDLLIVDDDTPRSGGIDFVQNIKADPLIGNKPKFILMIPLIREDLFEKIEALNIDFGITKPIIPSILYNGILEIFKVNVMALHDSSSNAEQTLDLIVDYPYHVLIVEDNKTNQFIAKSILEQAGFIISLADDGKMGVQFFEEHQQKIDLVLMDLHMPVLNGYEAAVIIRELNSSIPIVAMTADAITGVEAQCKSVGIDYYISKPFEPEQLVATIWNILKPLKKERQASNAKELSKEIINRDEAEAILSENEGIKRLGNNKDLYLMVLNEYYSENQDVLAILTSSISERHYQDAIQIVHKIKSSSGNIGAKRFFSVASRLQKALESANEAEIIRLHEQFQDLFQQLFNEIAKIIER